MLLPEGKNWVLLLCVCVCEKEAGGNEKPHTWRWRPQEACTRWEVSFPCLRPEGGVGAPP